tara:strand:- start:88 stop:300 length:213 start_codon:yes stop_codon:yes gene_type:complete
MKFAALALIATVTAIKVQDPSFENVCITPKFSDALFAKHAHGGLFTDINALETVVSDMFKENGVPPPTGD